MHNKIPLPNFTVIFTNQLRSDTPVYQELAARMSELAQEQKGLIAMDSSRPDVDITVSYWDSEEAILT